MLQIKKYAPDIYNAYKYPKTGALCDVNLDICANVLKRRYNDRFYDLEGAELSGDDTDTDEY